jgi:hypothetical protein
MTPFLRRLAVSLAAAVAATAASAWLFGPRGLLAGGIAAFLWLAWRHDNRVGACLPIAVLLVIVLCVILVLFSLVLIIHPR